MPLDDERHQGLRQRRHGQVGVVERVDGTRGVLGVNEHARQQQVLRPVVDEDAVVGALARDVEVVGAAVVGLV